MIWTYPALRMTLIVGAALVVGCAAGGADCEYDGQTYKPGDSFDATDGCNTCSCDDGAVSCTEIACDSGA